MKPTSRHRSQDAPPAPSSAEFITVTLPVHPFCGRRLVLIYSAVTKDGRRYVHVEGPRREMIVLPEEWTDRGAPVATLPRVGEREVLLSARGLLELAPLRRALLRTRPSVRRTWASSAGSFNSASTSPRWTR